MSWKDLFWRSGESGNINGSTATAPPVSVAVSTEAPRAAQPVAVPAATPATGDLEDEELASIIEANQRAAPSAPPAVVGSCPIPVSPDAEPLAGADHDVAGDEEIIVVAPDSDELQQLSAFLSELDPAMSPAARTAAANAFVRALGKKPAELIANAVQKLERLRGNLGPRDRALRESRAREQAAIDTLQSQLAGHQQRIAQLTEQLTAMQKLVSEDEARLSELRQLFGAS